MPARGQIMAPLETRFFTKIDKSSCHPCWIWLGASNGNGYGSIWVNGERGYESVHRVSYELHFSQIEPGMLVCHRCDTPLCVNPAHLFLGTLQDNVKDMVRKKRSSGLGVKNNGAKLTEFQVLEIRRSSAKATELALLYGLTRSQIHRIRSGRSWKHLTEF